MALEHLSTTTSGASRTVLLPFSNGCVFIASAVRSAALFLEKPFLVSVNLLLDRNIDLLCGFW